MNSVSVLYWLSLHVEHVHAEQAKLSRYSLRSTYEQPNIHIIHNTINNNVKITWLLVWMFVWLHHTVYVRQTHKRLEKPRKVRIF